MNKEKIKAGFNQLVARSKSVHRLSRKPTSSKTTNPKTNDQPTKTIINSQVPSPARTSHQRPSSTIFSNSLENNKALLLQLKQELDSNLQPKLSVEEQNNEDWINPTTKSINLADINVRMEDIVRTNDEVVLRGSSINTASIQKNWAISAGCSNVANHHSDSDDRITEQEPFNSLTTVVETVEFDDFGTEIDACDINDKATTVIKLAEIEIKVEDPGSKDTVEMDPSKTLKKKKNKKKNKFKKDKQVVSITLLSEAQTEIEEEKKPLLIDKEPIVTKASYPPLSTTETPNGSGKTSIDKSPETSIPSDEISEKSPNLTESYERTQEKYESIKALKDIKDQQTIKKRLSFFKRKRNDEVTTRRALSIEGPTPTLPRKNNVYRKLKTQISGVFGKKAAQDKSQKEEVMHDKIERENYTIPDLEFGSLRVSFDSTLGRISSARK